MAEKEVTYEELSDAGISLCFATATSSLFSYLMQKAGWALKYYYNSLKTQTMWNDQTFMILDILSIMFIIQR